MPQESRRATGRQGEGLHGGRDRAEDGEKALAAVDNLGAQGAQDFIIRTRDVKLGSALVAKALANDIEMMAVDDQTVDGAGRPLAEVPRMVLSQAPVHGLILILAVMPGDVRTRALRPS